MDWAALADSSNEFKGAEYEKNNSSLVFEKKSHFNNNLDSYVDENGNYVYTCWVKRGNGKWEREGVDIIPFTEENVELILMLDQDDHNSDLQERYDEENSDYGIQNQQNNLHVGYENEDNFDSDPIESIPDPKGDIFTQLYPEEEIVNPDLEAMEIFVRTELSEEQQNLFFAHMGERKYLEDIGRDEEESTGRKITKQAVHGRWDRILTKTCKHFGVAKPKQEHKKRIASSRRKRRGIDFFVLYWRKKYQSLLQI